MGHVFSFMESQYHHELVDHGFKIDILLFYKLLMRWS
ncbi:MAG: hypothetical protein J0H93_05975 [Chlamydiales bacterium]|nr:hypothetical protein [Chlamydiales bacterium]